MNKQQTPLEKLISDKNRLQERCLLQEQKLNADFTYIQENAASILLSGFSALVFPKQKQASPNTGQTAYTKEDQNIESLGLTDILSLGRSMMPVAWDIIKPILISWGIKKAGSVLSKVLFKKKM